ncbi:regulator of G-protein signaling 21-like [Astyanax mexicanus]|uniref:regulator of G-protein signaling 21-like n=1 Tax=Astyanax mexicanus TaxID=7994 RepID=UPI0020CAF731|nr:regulator of G-protein signaling 21-like [Astyanax mexicanus]
MEVATEGQENAGGPQHPPRFNTHRRWKSKLHLLLKKKKKLPVSNQPERRELLYRPTQSEVQQWGQSLEKLLVHPCGVLVFQMFSKSEFCEENLEFWLACEDFKKSKTSETLAIKAQNIYDKFLRKDSPKEINLDFRTKEHINQCLQQPSSNSFDEAQRRIFYLMENNSYPRFLESDFYQGLSSSKGLHGPHKPQC